MPDGGDGEAKRAQKERPCSKCEQRATRRSTGNETERGNRHDCPTRKRRGRRRSDRDSKQKTQRVPADNSCARCLNEGCRGADADLRARAHTNEKRSGAAGRRRGARAHSSGQGVTRACARGGEEAEKDTNSNDQTETAVQRRKGRRDPGAWVHRPVSLSLFLDPPRESSRRPLRLSVMTRRHRPMISASRARAWY